MRDEALLLDIVNAAKDARSFVDGMNWSAFGNSRLHQNDVIRSLEVIGEAAAKLSDEFRKDHEALDWPNVINMRHRLIHAYGDVRLDIVWHVLMTKLPPMIEILEPLIPPPEAP